VTTNVVDGRIYVMLLDSPGLRPPPQAHVSLEQMFRLAQRVATQFVDEAMGPRDLMAVIHVQGNQSDAQGFTSDKGLLRAAIARMKPDLDLFGTRQGDDTFPEKYCDVEKIRTSYEALETVSERLGATTGRRKAILWINGAVPLDADDPDECGRKGNGDGAGDLAGAQAYSLQFIQRDAIRVATRNNVAIYPIDAVGLTADPRYFKTEQLVRPDGSTRTPTPGNTISDDEPPARKLRRLAALRGIAGETGGEAIVNTNNFSGGFERVVQLHSTYYLLGYRPARDHRDGQFHSITVRVRRPNVTVRARKGYRAPEGDTPSEARLMPGVSPAAVAALTNPFPSNGLKLQTFLAPFSGTGNDAVVLLGAEVSGLARADAETRLEFAYLALDTQGGTFVTPSKTLPLKLPDGTGAASVRYVDRLRLPPGRHEVRFAVYQAGGETGSVVTHVDVPDFTRAPLTMSGIVLIESENASPPMLVGDELLENTPAATSTTRRRFARSETITAMAELYTEPRRKVEDVEMTAAILNAQGAKVRTETPTRPGGELGRVGYTVRLPLADLPPGDYALTMEGRAGRRTVSRQVPFSVAAE